MESGRLKSADRENLPVGEVMATTGAPDPPASPPDRSAVEGPAQLRDGQKVRVRRMSLSDREQLQAFLRRLSDASLAARFFAPVPRSTALLELFDGILSTERCALVMLAPVEGREEIIAHAVYARDGVNAPAAEVAFLVADAFRAHGCATILLHRLAHAARGAGIREFRASVLSENEQMLEVFRGSGFPTREWWGPDAVQVTFPIGERFEHPPGGPQGSGVPA